eukprot:COSAG06_NODE_30255_length_542_cov_0.704289_1_plen_47_part_10
MSDVAEGPERYANLSLPVAVHGACGCLAWRSRGGRGGGGRRVAYRTH